MVVCALPIMQLTLKGVSHDTRRTAMWIWSLRPSRAFEIAVASGLGACQGIETAEPPEPAVSSRTAAVNVDDKCDWEQWGGNPAHTGQGCKEVDHMDRISAHMTFDPFLEQELAD